MRGPGLVEGFGPLSDFSSIFFEQVFFVETGVLFVCSGGDPSVGCPLWAGDRLRGHGAQGAWGAPLRLREVLAQPLAARLPSASLKPRAEFASPDNHGCLLPRFPPLFQLLDFVFSAFRRGDKFYFHKVDEDLRLALDKPPLPGFIIPVVH